MRNTGSDVVPVVQRNARRRIRKCFTPENPCARRGTAMTASWPDIAWLYDPRFWEEFTRRWGPMSAYEKEMVAALSKRKRYLRRTHQKTAESVPARLYGGVWRRNSPGLTEHHQLKRPPWPTVRTTRKNSSAPEGRGVANRAAQNAVGRAPPVHSKSRRLADFSTGSKVFAH